MSHCTEADFQKIKSKLVANGDLPSGGIVVAAASKAAQIEASIGRASRQIKTSGRPDPDHRADWSSL